MVDETSRWFDKGCVGEVACSPVAEILANKPPRAKKAKIDGVWIGSSICLGKDRVQTYETFVAVPGCRPEYRSMPMGAAVVVDDTPMVCMRAMRVPLSDEVEGRTAGKYRMAALVVSLEDAWKGAVPCLTLAFMGSKTSWRVVPLSRLCHVEVSDLVTDLHAPRDEFKVRVCPQARPPHPHYPPGERVECDRIPCLG